MVEYLVRNQMIKVRFLIIPQTIELFSFLIRQLSWQSACLTRMRSTVQTCLGSFQKLIIGYLLCIRGYTSLEGKSTPLIKFSEITLEMRFLQDKSRNQNSQNFLPPQLRSVEHLTFNHNIIVLVIRGSRVQSSQEVQGIYPLVTPFLLT